MCPQPTRPSRPTQDAAGLGQGFSCVHIAGSQALASRWCAGRHSQRVPSPSRPRLATHVTLIALVTVVEALLCASFERLSAPIERVFYKTAEATAALPAKRCISGGQGFRVAGGGRRRSVAESGRPRLRSNPPWPSCMAQHSIEIDSCGNDMHHDMHHWPTRAKLRREFKSCDLPFLALPAAIGLPLACHDSAQQLACMRFLSGLPTSPTRTSSTIALG